MYITRPWTVRQYAGFSTAEESNAFYRRNLAAGQMGPRWRSIWPRIAATIPTTRGWWATSAKPGVAIDSVEDMKILFDQIPLEGDLGVHDHERRGAAGDGLLHRCRRGAGGDAGEAGGHHPERHPQRVHGAEHVHLSARTVPCASVGDIFRFTAENMPKFNSISISGYHMQEAGATEDIELWRTRWPTAWSMYAPASPPG